CVVAYICFVELRGIEEGRVELRVSLDSKIIFVEGVFAIDVKLDARGDPAWRELPIILEAGVVNFRRIVFIRRDQSNEEQMLLLNPELLGLQIAFGGSNYVDILPIPLLFADL